MLQHFMAPSGHELLEIQRQSVPREGDRVTLADKAGISCSYYVESIAWCYFVSDPWTGDATLYHLRNDEEVYIYLYRPHLIPSAWER